MSNEYENELVSRVAPRWAWETIDQSLDDFREQFGDGEYVMPEEKKLRADIARAVAAMIDACEDSESNTGRGW